LIDFIKFQPINTPCAELEENHLLGFRCFVNPKTGETNGYMSARYQGLLFKIYDTTISNPNGRITVEGSLHKYWNSGLHNFNDFNIYHLYWVVQDLNEKFNIDASNCILRQVEIGVNISPPKQTKAILDCCILHKTTPFKWMYTKDEGDYIQARHQRYFIKIYNKRKHYEKQGYLIDKEIFRFEIKYRKMKALNDGGIHTLHDLYDADFKGFKEVLLTEWNNVLFADSEALKGHKNEYKYRNLNYWTELNSNKLKYHRNQLNKVLKNCPDNSKYNISERIKSKAEFLAHPHKTNC
jgi:hypothetical protein